MVLVRNAVHGETILATKAVAFVVTNAIKRGFLEGKPDFPSKMMITMRCVVST